MSLPSEPELAARDWASDLPGSGTVPCGGEVPVPGGNKKEGLMACASTCPTQDHPSLGACLRAKNVGDLYVSNTNGCDSTHVKRFDAEIDAYRSAYRQGVRPDGSRMHQIQEAMRISEATGKPYVSTQ